MLTSSSPINIQQHDNIMITSNSSSNIHSQYSKSQHDQDYRPLPAVLTGMYLHLYMLTNHDEFLHPYI